MARETAPNVTKSHGTHNLLAEVPPLRVKLLVATSQKYINPRHHRRTTKRRTTGRNPQKFQSDRAYYTLGLECYYPREEYGNQQLQKDQ